MPITDQPNLFPSLDSIEPILWPGAAVLVFVVTAVLVDLLVLIAARWRLVDMPNRRSAHALPTARGGGLAIVLTATLAALALVLRWPPATNQLLVGVLLPCLAVAILGVIDDIQPLNAVLRLFIHVAAATTVTAVLGPIREIALPGLPVLELGGFGWPLTIVWIVGMTNAFNFMDGSDGMAGTGAVVGGVALALVGWQLRMHLPMMLAAFMAAAAGGFLVFNWQPARVFMGDVGSGFLGMLLAAIPLMFPEPQQSLVIVPAICGLWPYVFDPFVSVLRRLFDGENPLVPHREFFFHRLIRSGVSHAAAATLYGALAAVGGLVGWTLVNPAVPTGVRTAAPLLIVGLAGLLAWGVESRCRRVGIDAQAAVRAGGTGG